jgi:hypothetical protein
VAVLVVRVQLNGTARETLNRPDRESYLERCWRFECPSAANVILQGPAY